MKRLIVIASLSLGTLLALLPPVAQADDFMVYSVYRALDLGNPGETPQKDFFINMGSAQGLRPGAVVEVIRKLSTYDLVTEKLYKDMRFPIATLKVIHVESNAAVARLDKMVSAEQTPSLSPRAVMVGDIVRK